MAIASIVAAVQAKARALDGVKGAPDNPPESINQFPFAVAYPGSLTADPMSDGWRRGLGTIICDIHCARLLLPTAVAQAVPLGDAFINAILGDLTLGGVVDTVRQVRAQFAYLTYAGQPNATIGWHVEIDYKREEDNT